MTRIEFNRLSYLQKLGAVFQHGTFLMRRPALGSYYADLFHMPSGYFVECFYQATTHRLLMLRSLPSCYRFAAYLDTIALPID